MQIIHDDFLWFSICLSNFVNGEILFNVGVNDNFINASKQFINLELVDIYDIYWPYI